jgi:hypothetical protein
MLLFDPETHTYTFRGQVLPSVTQVLEPLFHLEHVREEVLRDASTFGQAVHAATELDDAQTLDVADLDERLLPYVRAWRKFILQKRVEILATEQKLGSPILGFAGRLDRRAAFDRSRWILDIKSSASLHPVYGVQLAGYERLVKLEHPEKWRRAVVLLRPDGEYRFQEYTDALDHAAFVSLLTLRNWRTKHEVKQ